MRKKKRRMDEAWIKLCEHLKTGKRNGPEIFTLFHPNKYFKDLFDIRKAGLKSHHLLLSSQLQSTMVSLYQNQHLDLS
jgi:hypothetical protein